MKISPRTDIGVNLAAFLRSPQRAAGADAAPDDASTQRAGAARRRPDDANSLLRSQVATQARFGRSSGPAGSVAPTEGGVTGTGADVRTSSVDELLARLPEDVQEEVKRFVSGAIAADYYTPENTADRIVTFALGGFERFEGGAAAQENTAAARQRFVDFILPAIDKGYGEALDVLGDLADDVLSGLERTRALIGERLEDFAAQESIEVDA